MAWPSQSAASTIPIREEAGGKSIPSHSSKTQRRYPDDAVHHKNHIPKVMFLLATAEPHIKPGPVQSFSSGKIGIWPFVQYVEAKRSSIKRPRGTVEIKNVSVTAQVFKDKMLEKDVGVFDVITTKLGEYVLGENAIGVVIGLDNATPHKQALAVREIMASGISNGRNIKLRYQPAHSPECNINDLAFINGLQKKIAKFKHECHTIDAFVKKSIQCFEDYDDDTLGRIVGLEYVIYREILEHNGGNQFAIPHTGIRRRQKQERQGK